eukprot:TRINITY_DN4379_c4_g1_i1.p1 TRINITY_DN4379_c4_g1~~TRINITY_DN4379_c4_g1_i1.p1  ORF type:complete len:483 (-),score=117.43 TRINITY_DN4379_c4_g1_i1:246-1625(-)
MAFHALGNEPRVSEIRTAEASFQAKQQPGKLLACSRAEDLRELSASIEKVCIRLEIWQNEKGLSLKHQQHHQQQWQVPDTQPTVSPLMLQRRAVLKQPVPASTSTADAAEAASTATAAAAASTGLSKAAASAKTTSSSAPAKLAVTEAEAAGASSRTTLKGKVAGPASPDLNVTSMASLGMHTAESVRQDLETMIAEHLPSKGYFQRSPLPADLRLSFPLLLPSYLPNSSSCSSGCGAQPAVGSFGSALAEMEFSVWGFCPACQMTMFPPASLVPDSSESQCLLIESGSDFAMLSPLSAVPVAFPDNRTVWNSPYHLYIAHHFVDPKCREIVHAAPLGCQARALRELLRAPELRSAVRSDWAKGWAIKAMRHVIFLAVEQHPTLKAALMATGSADLVFIGGQHEQFWGICLPEEHVDRLEMESREAFIGQNLVGKILKEKRALLLSAQIQAIDDEDETF